MNVFQKLIAIGLILYAINSFANAPEVLSTHIYDDLAIQDISTKKSDYLYIHKIIISRATFEKNPVRSDFFKVPRIGKPIWEITAKDLHVTQYACLEIDALLCRDYHEMYKPSEYRCYGACISNGPDFVAFNEKTKTLYLSAGTNVSGTGGMPLFLFAVDINKKQIKFLNTFRGHFDAHLSPNGKYLAIADDWGNISICEATTGKTIEIYEDNIDKYNHGLKFIAWLNNKELKYQDIQSDKESHSIIHARVNKIFVVEK